MAIMNELSYHGHVILFFMSLTSVNINQCTSSAKFFANFFARKRAYAGSSAFLLQFEEVGYPITLNACGGIWWQCFIGTNMQRLVSSAQRLQFWPERQKAWESAQEGWGPSIAGSFGRGRYPIAKNTCRAIRCYSTMQFPYVYMPWERFPSRQRTIAHVKNGPNLLGNTQLGGATPCRLFTRPGPLPSTTCFRRWATSSLSSTSILTKTSENDLMSGFPRKRRNFLTWYPQIAWEMGKMCS